MGKAIDIDEENKNKVWWEALMLEMKNVRPAFEIFKDTIEIMSIGLIPVRFHIILDVKLGGTLDERLVL